MGHFGTRISPLQHDVTSMTMNEWHGEQWEFHNMYNGKDNGKDWDLTCGWDKLRTGVYIDLYSKTFLTFCFSECYPCWKSGTFENETCRANHECHWSEEKDWTHKTTKYVAAVW